ncbi:MAG: hypothetical protein GY854_10390 [Deltaproteobacteria bacterium]|nr:hypothetical protein [Deltaproteobacteria bacterium]
MRILFFLVFLTIGCGGNGKNGSKAEPEPTEPSEKMPDPASKGAFEGPGGEIVPGLKIPKAGIEGKGTDEPSLPTDRDGLFAAARKALDAGKADEALSYLTVLLVMNPDDPELLEFHGDILLGQDQPEDAMVDFGRCCELGRQSCCERKKDP